MKNLFRTAALVSVLAIAVSCGAVIDSSNSSEDLAAKSFDPMAAYPQAKLAASGITSGITAISLSATRKETASMKSTSSTSFTWVWTVVGADGMFVDVEVSPSGAKVIDHERRMIVAYQATFEPKNVSVTGTDVLTLAAQQKSGLPTDLYLGANVIDSGASQLRWAVGFANGEVLVDGDTGDIVK